MTKRTAWPMRVDAGTKNVGTARVHDDSRPKMTTAQRAIFYRGDHRALFAEIVGLIANGVGVDVVTLYERLKALGRADDLWGMSYLNSLAREAPSAVSVARNANVVVDRARKRGLLAVAAEMQESVGATADDAATLIDRAAARLESLGEATVKRELTVEGWEK